MKNLLGIFPLILGVQKVPETAKYEKGDFLPPRN
jgi:hypothetical protein